MKRQKGNNAKRKPYTPLTREQVEAKKTKSVLNDMRKAVKGA